MTDGAEDKPIPSTRRYGIIAMAAIGGLAIGLVGVYGIAGFGGNAPAPECRSALALARNIAPLARGEVAALAIADDPQKLPPLAFQDATGATRSLADWRGRTVLLNLWATWCVPCRKEMPTLDALQGRLGGADFEVVAVNIDTRDTDKPKTWLKDAGVRRLSYFADPNARIFQELKVLGKAVGMPTTLLIDRSGCEIATLAGPAEWASDDAVKLVQTAIAQGKAE
jgi:thiol-disulfide isomerase/thioredoxin